MSTPDEALRKVIDEAVGPLIADHRRYLADVNAPLLAVSKADLHYVFDQYSTQLLDFTAQLAPVGHRHPFVHNAVKEHMEYYMRTAPVGDHVLRWPVEYAKRLADTFAEYTASASPKVLFTEGEREALLAAIAQAFKARRYHTLAVVDTGVHRWCVGIYGAACEIVVGTSFSSCGAASAILMTS